MDFKTSILNDEIGEHLNGFLNEESEHPTSKKINEQFVTRSIRKAVEAFDHAETVDDKLRAIMAVASFGALNLITNKSMIVSTSRFIEAKMRI